MIVTISVVNNCMFALSTGFAARFGGNESFIRNIGFPIAGVATNFIAFICTYYSESLPSNYQFLSYLLLSDTLVVAHFINMHYFYKRCKNNEFVFNVEKEDNSNTQIRDTNTRERSDTRWDALILGLVGIGFRLYWSLIVLVEGVLSNVQEWVFMLTYLTMQRTKSRKYQWDPNRTPRERIFS